MIEYVQTDIFASSAQTLVNTVNTVGVMGKGLALAFKRQFPIMYADYRKACESGRLTVGKLHLFVTPDRWILNFPTKEHWRRPSSVQILEAGLRCFVESYKTLGITSIAFPQLGCSNGGLDWEQVVQPLMERFLEPLPLQVFLHIRR